VAGCARTEKGGVARARWGRLRRRRADNQRNSAALTALRGRAEAAEAALEPLRARGCEAAAQAESHAEEVKAVRAPRPRSVTTRLTVALNTRRTVSITRLTVAFNHAPHCRVFEPATTLSVKPAKLCLIRQSGRSRAAALAAARGAGGGRPGAKRPGRGRAQARATADAWEKRARQLQQKYGKVDLAEHQGLAAELAAAREAAAALQAALTAKEAELAQARARPAGPRGRMTLCAARAPVGAPMHGHVGHSRSVRPCAGGQPRG